MGAKHRTGRTLTRYDQRGELRRVCGACTRVLAVRVSAKGYPGQDADVVQFDCPACGAADVVSVGVPDTGGAEIRALPPWARLEERDVDSPVAKFVGGSFLGFLVGLAVFGAAHGWFPWGQVREVARFCAAITAEGALVVGVLTRAPVKRWMGGDSAREVKVMLFGGVLLALSIPLLARLLD